MGRCLRCAFARGLDLYRGSLIFVYGWCKLRLCVSWKSSSVFSTKLGCAFTVVPCVFTVISSNIFPIDVDTVKV